MKKHFCIYLLAVVMLFSGCAAETSSSDTGTALSEQQQEFDRACSLLDAGKYDEAEVILTGLADFPSAYEKLLELQQARLQHKLRDRYAGVWVISDFSGNNLILSLDGTGSIYSSDGMLAFSYYPTDSAINTDCKSCPEFNLEMRDSVRVLTLNDEEYYFESDITALPEPEKIEITSENWSDYFEIITDCFAESWSDGGDLDYYSEILYFLPTAEIRGRMSPFHQFDLTFSVKYVKNLYYIGVDHDTYMPIGLEKTTPDKIGNYEGECVLNQQALKRIDSNELLYSDGFAHQSLRPDSYGKYARYYDVAENVTVTGVSGCIYLYWS